MRQYCKQKRIKFGSVQFQFDGELVDPLATPLSLELESDFCIDVLPLWIHLFALPLVQNAYYLTVDQFPNSFVYAELGFLQLWKTWKSRGIYYFWKTRGNLKCTRDFFISDVIFSRCNLKHTTRQVGNLTFPHKKGYGWSKIWKKMPKWLLRWFSTNVESCLTLKLSGKNYSGGLENPENSRNFIWPNL